MGKKEEAPDLNANNEEEWDRLKACEGLLVVDIYSKWAGPCSVMKAIIFKIKGKLQVLDTMEDLVQYGTGCSDTIPELKPFKNICMPTFLFYASGIPVGFVHGANGGRMREAIFEAVKREMLVRAGECERQAIELEMAVPYQYEETEEEREMGIKTVENVKSLKKKVMVATLLNN